jgi:hypothetical protein
VRGAKNLKEIALSGLGLAAVAVAIFWKADGALSDELRAALSRSLRRLGAEYSRPNWADYFIALFDRVFGKKHFSINCFFRSCIATSVSLAALLSIWAILRPGQAGLFFSPHVDNTHSASNVPLWITYMWLPVAYNFLADYASLLETRFVLRWARATKRRWHVPAILFVDALLSIGIFMAFFWTISIILELLVFRSSDLWIFFNWSVFFDNFKVLLESGVLFSGIHSSYPFPLGLLLDTTLLTSVWLWLYLVGFGLLWLFSPLIRLLGFLKWALPIDRYPMRSIGVVVAFVLCLTNWIWGTLERVW